MTGKLRQMEQEGRVFDDASVQADFSWHLSLIVLKDNDEIQLLVTSVELQWCLKTKQTVPPLIGLKNVSPCKNRLHIELK